MTIHLRDILNPPHAAIAGLTLALLFTLTQGINHWLEDWALIHHPVLPLTLTTHSPATLTHQAINGHLFGEHLTALGEVPITNLALRITGISKVYHEKGNTISHATISINDATDKMYQVGDALPDGVKIYSIENNAVILENEGRLEKLPLARSTLNFQPAPQTGELS